MQRPKEPDLLAALAVVHQAEQFVLAYAKARGLPVGHCHIDGPDLYIRIEGSARMFFAPSGKRAMSATGATTITGILVKIDEAAAAYKKRRL